MAACGNDSDDEAADETTAPAENTSASTSPGSTDGTVPSGDLQSLSVRLNVDATGTHAPFVLAQKNGWYAEEGLDVAFGEGGGSDTTVALIDTGDDDIGIAGFDAVAVLRAEGAEVKVIGAWEQRSPLAIITVVGSDITEPADLEGATVVMDQGDIPLFEAYAVRAGIDASAVETVTITEEAQSAALAAGRIDGILGWTTLSRTAGCRAHRRR